jgi:two-component system response regulator FixJ
VNEDAGRLMVFIVDDDGAIRDALSLLLSLHGYPTATFASAEALLATLDAESAGCIVADVKMPGMSGLELQQALRSRAIQLPVVIITAHGDVASARAAFRADAVDFLEKPFDDQAALSAVAAGMARERSRLAAGRLEQRREENLAALTERERGVMDLLVQGLHNRDVAERLGISPRTVEVHKARVMEKLGARNLVDLIRAAERSSTEGGGT